MTTFKDHAEDLLVVGLIPLPVIDKRPCVSGFQKWNGMSMKTLRSLQSQFPNSDLALLTRASGLIVLDIDSDDPSLIAWARDEFGYTPLYCKTKRGYHFYYKNPLKIAGAIGQEYPVDIKGAGASDYVVFPPTQNYQFHQTYLDRCKPDSRDSEFYGHLEVLNTAPSINAKGLSNFFPRHRYINRNTPRTGANDNFAGPTELVPFRNPSSRRLVTPEASSVPSLSLTPNDHVLEGNRNQWLFNEALTHAAIIVNRSGHSDESLAELQKTISDRNIANCFPPLSAQEVARLTNSAWYNYELKGENRKHVSHEECMTAVLLTSEAITEAMSNPFAFCLLLWLTSHHDKDSEFILNVAGLRRATGWGLRKVNKAKVHLIDEGYVEQVTEHNRLAGLAAKFVFTEKATALNRRIIQDENPISNDNDIPEIAIDGISNRS